MGRARTLLKSAALMIGPVRRLFEQRDTLLIERNALAAQVRDFQQRSEMPEKQPETPGDPRVLEQKTLLPR